MATATAPRTKKTAKSGTTKAPTAKTVKVKAEVEDTGPSKTELRRERDAKMTETMLEMRANGESWGAVAEELSITPGKAQFLNMLHLVATGEVPALAFSDDDELTEVCQEARAALNEFSSWGWIAARTGVSEAKIKRLLEEAGTYVPKQQNISVDRAKANADDEDAEPKAKAKRTTKATAKADAEPASRAAKAKARAKRAKGGATDPS